MILREVTDADLEPLVRLAKRVLGQLGVHARDDLSAGNVRRGGTRIVVLYDGTVLTASLSAIPIDTDRGAGYRVVSFLVRQERKDKVDLFDALSLYALNIAASEGRHAVFTERLRRIPGIVYGRDHLGMDGSMGDGYTLYQWGDAKVMMARIFERHPEWQLL